MALLQSANDSARFSICAYEKARKEYKSASLGFNEMALVKSLIASVYFAGFILV
jgi:hypothetical protein